MTTLQNAMIMKIAENDFTVANGDTPKSLEDIGQVWADMVIETAQDKGVFTSLMNAGCVTHTGFLPSSSCTKSDSTLSLTEKGFEEYKKIKYAQPKKISETDKLKSIMEIIDDIAGIPAYAYGDNECACKMMDAIKKIGGIILTEGNK